jgi:uncharacterized membrane protein YqjE
LFKKVLPYQGGRIMKFYENPKFKIVAIIFVVFGLILHIYLAINSSGSDTSISLIFVFLLIIALLALIWDYNSSKKHNEFKKNLNKFDSSKKTKIKAKTDGFNSNVLASLSLIFGIVIVFYFDYRTNLIINIIGWINILMAVVIFKIRDKID